MTIFHFDIFELALLDVRLQVDVIDQNIVKHPLGMYRRISTPYADPITISVGMCVSYGKYQRDA